MQYRNFTLPVPELWKTDDKGKIFIFESYWPKLCTLINTENQMSLSKKFDISRRTIREWKSKRTSPKLYTKSEFSFTKSNLYWFGMYFSDGHLRNNGSKCSFTYQTGSSDIFQGYWYPQVIQRFLPIFKHKPKNSLTYINCRTRAFVANLSAISPIFMRFLLLKNLISKRQDTVTSGYSKRLPSESVKDLSNEEFFQGLFDGDGHVSLSGKNGIVISLALDPLLDHTKLISSLPLVPTLSVDPNRKSECYTGSLTLDVRLAPASLVRVNSKYSAEDIVDQLEFMLNSAKNSIRPDKVHSLISVVKRITSKEYGEYRNCNSLQRKIRDLAITRRLDKLANDLKLQYPIKNNKYQPFRPNWAKELCSKRAWFQEAWDFFQNLESLDVKEYDKKIDVSEGVPVDFRL